MSQDPEVVRQNDQYAIESLKHRLRETNKEHSDLQAMFDFHLTELEDKKSKVSSDYDNQTTKLSSGIEDFNGVIFFFWR